MIGAMTAKPKNPARPKVQPKAAAVKKRRRQRRPDLAERDLGYGRDAALDYQWGAGWNSRRNKAAEAFADQSAPTAMRRARLRAVGRQILKSCRGESEDRMEATRAGKRRRTAALLAQVARRSGRSKVKSDSFNRDSR